MFEVELNDLWWSSNLTRRQIMANSFVDESPRRGRYTALFYDGATAGDSWCQAWPCCMFPMCSCCCVVVVVVVAFLSWNTEGHPVCAPTPVPVQVKPFLFFSGRSSKFCNSRIYHQPPSIGNSAVQSCAWTSRGNLLCSQLQAVCFRYVVTGYISNQIKTLKWLKLPPFYFFIFFNTKRCTFSAYSYIYISVFEFDKVTNGQTVSRQENGENQW